MKTYNITLSQKQFEIVQRAVEMSFDMENDMCLDEVWASEKVDSVSRQSVIEMRQITAEKVANLLELQAVVLALKSMK